MKKFEFRLEAALRLRNTQLAIEKNKLQQLHAELAKLEKNLRSITDERRESAEWIQRMSEPASSDIRALSAFLLGSKAREATLRQSIESCAEEIRDQRQRTLVAERNQKLLMNLRVKQRSLWQQEFDKELEMVAQEAWQAAARFKAGP